MDKNQPLDMVGCGGWGGVRSGVDRVGCSRSLRVAISNLTLFSHSLQFFVPVSYGPRQANLVLIAYASSEGSGEPAHSRSLARTFAAGSYKQ